MLPSPCPAPVRQSFDSVNRDAPIFADVASLVGLLTREATLFVLRYLCGHFGFFMLASSFVVRR